MKVRGIETDHKYGYTTDALRQIFTNEWELEEFFRWMYGQTAALSDDGEPIYYHSDVARFASGARKVWD